jgi:hypothetical protein
MLVLTVVRFHPRGLLMGGFRSDGKLLESLQRAVEVLFEMGQDELSDDVEEAIARLRPIYPESPRILNNLEHP